jgi:hypothetical protein
MRFQLESSPALALLHKRHASILVSFFHKTFRESHVAEVPEERLEGRWETFIEEDVALSDWEEERPTNTAKAYLEEWCRQRWLARRYSEEDGTYLYRLTTNSEQALLFVEQHLTTGRRTFVGTESNFSKIWHSLTELSEKTQNDPKVRENQLLVERDRIDEELMELRRTGTPRKLDHNQAIPNAPPSSHLARARTTEEVSGVAHRPYLLCPTAVAACLCQFDLARRRHS